MKSKIETVNCKLTHQTVNILTKYQIVAGMGRDTACAEFGPRRCQHESSCVANGNYRNCPLKSDS